MAEVDPDSVAASSTGAQSLRAWFREEKDLYLLEAMGWFLLLVSSSLVLMDLLNIQVPYGRYGDNKGILSYILLTRLKISAKVGWFIMEMPSFVIPLYFILNVGGKNVGEFNPNMVLLGMFILHYFNRYIVVVQ